MKKLLTFLFFLLSSFGFGQQIDFTTDNYQFDNNVKAGYFTVTLANPSASAITVSQPSSFPSSGQMSITGYGDGNHKVRVWAPTFSTVTIPAGGTLVKSLNLAGGNDVGNNVSTFSAVQTWSGSLSLTVNGSAVLKSLQPFTFRIKAVGTADNSITPAGPRDLGTVYLSTPPALAKITINADAAAAGARQYKVGTGSPVDVTLTEGANVVVNNSNPGLFADGATVLVLQTGTTIGTGTIVKDSFGNFDLTVNATGIPAPGVLTITWPALFNGQAATLTEGFEAPQNITLSGASYVQNYNPGTTVANGTIFVVKVNGTPVGTGVVVYGSGSGGGWVVNIVLQGGEDLNPGVDEALFVLDLAAYNNASVILNLVVDGVEYSVATVAGDAAKGIRSIRSYRLSNTSGALNGKPYAWKITGVDGPNIYQGVTIAAGITPSTVQLDVGAVDSSKSFRVDNSATINGNAPDGPPANTYDPAAPPVHDPGATPEQIAAENTRVAEKKDNYEAVNKAVSDAVNGSTVANAAMPGTGEGTAGGQLGAAASNRAKGAVEAALDASGLSQYVPVGTWSGTSALEIGLPGAGTIYLDATDYGIAPAVIRAVILMGLLWVYWKMCIIMLRNSVAG